MQRIVLRELLISWWEFLGSCYSRAQCGFFCSGLIKKNSCENLFEQRTRKPFAEVHTYLDMASHWWLIVLPLHNRNFNETPPTMCLMKALCLSHSNSKSPADMFMHFVCIAVFKNWSFYERAILVCSKQANICYSRQSYNVLKLNFHEFSIQCHDSQIWNQNC